MKNTSNVIAIYSRKSKFTGKGESIGNQVEFSDVDYNEDSTEDFGRHTKTDLGEDSK